MEEESWHEYIREGLEQDISMSNLLNFKFPDEVNLRVVAESWRPHVGKVLDPHTQKTSFKGPVMRMLQAFSESLNFTFTMVEGDGFFGAPRDDGKFDGMIGMVQRHEVDIALGPFAITHERSQVADFTVPLMTEKYRILMKRPQITPNPYGLVAPFSTSVWIGILIGILSVFVTMSFMARFSKFRKDTAYDFAWLILCIVCKQAFPWEPTKASLRLCLATLMVVAIIITNTYGSALTSQLAVKRLNTKHETLQQVVDDPDIKIVMEGKTALTSFMEASETGIYSKFSAAAKLRGQFLNTDDLWSTGKEVLRGTDYLLIMEEYTIKRFMDEHITELGTCGLYMSKGSFFPIMIAVALPKGSPLLPLFNARIMMYREFDIYNMGLSKALQNASLCLEPLRSGELNPYTLVDLKGAFLVMGLGLVASVAFFIIEKWKSML